MSEKKEEKNSLIVKSKVREYIKSKGCNSSAKVIDEGYLDKEIMILLDKACERAKANNRKTVQEKDL